MRNLRRLLPVFIAILLILTSFNFQRSVYANEVENEPETIETMMPLSTPEESEQVELKEVVVAPEETVVDQTEVIEIDIEEPIVEELVLDVPIIEDELIVTEVVEEPQPVVEEVVVEENIPETVVIEPLVEEPQPVFEEQPMVINQVLPDMTEIIGIRFHKDWDLEGMPDGTEITITAEVYNVDHPELTYNRSFTLTYPVGETDFVFGNLPYRNTDGTVANYSIREITYPDYIKPLPAIEIARPMVDAGSIQITEPQSQMSWDLNVPRFFVARINPSTSTTVVWTLNRLADDQRAAFIDQVVAAAVAAGYGNSPVFTDLLNPNQTIVWLYGPDLTYEINGETLTIDINFDPETGLAESGTLTFTNPSFWTHFAHGLTNSKTVQITNKYIQPIEFTPEVSKVFNAGDRLLKAGEFTFTLTDANGEVTRVETETNDAAGKVLFDPIEYNYADIGKSFTYTIKEVAGTEENINYDLVERTLTVTITEVNGVLIANANYSPDSIFTNVYEIPLIDVTARKVWDGGPSENHVAVRLVLERSLDGVTWTPVEANYEVTGVAPRFTYT